MGLVCRALQLDRLYVERFNSTSLASDAQLKHVIALTKPTRLRLGQAFHTQKGIQVFFNSTKIVFYGVKTCPGIILYQYYSFFKNKTRCFLPRSLFADTRRDLGACQVPIACEERLLHAKWWLHT
jgi:hypothetical protein